MILNHINGRDSFDAEIVAYKISIAVFKFHRYLKSNHEIITYIHRKDPDQLIKPDFFLKMFRFNT